ncbi:MAG: hypothetical protein JOZ96_21300 [Acidobacteria bacterium]|nr:hypothetical protein [Acidobacteriota bacterium]
MAKTEYSYEERRKILLENRYLLTEEQSCEKWGISRYRLRKWKKILNYHYLIGNLREMALVALYNGSHTIPAIIDHLDYLNHARYTEDEVSELLNNLKAEGMAGEKDGRWFYARPQPDDGASFIF